MKVVFSNSKIVFRSEKAWTDYALAYFSANITTGAFVSIDTPTQAYHRSGVGDYISIDEVGKQVKLVIPETSEMYVYAYDSNKDYLGHSVISDCTNGQVFNDVLASCETFLIGTTEQTRATVITNAAYFRVVFKQFASVDGYCIKVR